MTPLESIAILLHPTDDVAVLKRSVPAGTTVVHGNTQWTTTTDLPPGHKISIRPIPQGSPLRKYGQFIGCATRDIPQGAHVHVHNLEASPEFLSRSTVASPIEAATSIAPTLPPEILARNSSFQTRTFQGYTRADGRVGTRNYIGVISSVNCSASVSRYVADAFRHQVPSDAGWDGVIAFTHKSGCAMDPGEPQIVLRRVLAGMARHPNIGGFVVIGLGCEVNQTSALIEAHQLQSTGPRAIPTPVLNIQQVGSVRRTVELGIQAVRDLIPAVSSIPRTPHPLSKLVLALNCGGSDGHSGCTANPALGVASDLLVQAGGTAVLAETPEIFGAEHLLTRRATHPDVARKLMSRIEWWENHVRQHGTAVDNNPSFGNKQGGLTTLFEKSLGAVAKGGQSPLGAVYEYAEPISHPGFCFMDTPGYDPVSMTGLVAGGCNVAVFTTGRGSVYGCKPTPCLKIASHTALYRHMEEDMDMDAGTILSGTATVHEVGVNMLERIIAMASGERTKSERSGIGDEEFAPWTLGPTL